MRGGIIAIKIREDDEVVDVAITKKGDEVVLATARGMAIRFSEADARPMGRNTSGVKGINLAADDRLVGMVVAEPEASLLTACLNGYGKRTLFGPNGPVSQGEGDAAEDDDSPSPLAGEGGPGAPGEGEDGESESSSSSSNRYRTQRRGGKGLRDIKATDRNGPVIGITSVHDDDEILMMTARGKLQRMRAGEISVIGRNTQGVRIMSLDEGDTLAAIVRVPREEDNGNQPTTPRPAPQAAPPPIENEAEPHDDELEAE
jgi:DNA gyrase subunit A